MIPSSTRKVAWLVFAVVVVAVAGSMCTLGPNESSQSADSVRVPINLRLDRLECLDQNDAEGADDEIYLLVDWTGAENGQRQLPEDGGRWRMCGSNEFEPSELLETSIAPGESLAIHLEVVEDDSQAERVSNQIDDTLAHVSLELSVDLDENERLRAVVTPLPTRDNNAVGLLPPLSLDTDEASRSIDFEIAYENSDGSVRYAGRLTW